MPLTELVITGQVVAATAVMHQVHAAAMAELVAVAVDQQPTVLVQQVQAVAVH
jgi:hypothetical protein